MCVERIRENRPHLHRREATTERTGGEIQAPGRRIPTDTGGEAQCTRKDGPCRKRAYDVRQGGDHYSGFLEIVQGPKGHQGKEEEERRQEGKEMKMTTECVT